MPKRSRSLLLFACWIALLRLVKTTTDSLAQLDPVSGYPLWAHWAFALFSTITLLGTLAVGVHRPQVFGYRPVTACAAAGLAAGVGFLACAPVFPAGYMVGQCVAGASHAWLLACWLALLCSQQKPVRTWAIAASGLVASMALIVAAVVPVSTVVLLAISTIGCCAPLWLSSCADCRQCASPRKNSLPLELVLLMVSYSLLYRILDVFYLGAGAEGSQEARVLAGAVGTVGLGALVVYLHRMHYEPDVWQAALPLFVVTGIGVALLAFGRSVPHVITIALAGSSWTLFYIPLWLILLCFADQQGTDPLATCLLGWTILNVAALGGIPVANLLYEQVGAGALSATAVLLVMLYTLLVGIVVYRGSVNRTFKQEPPVPTHAQWQAQQATYHESLAEAHGLTARESQVFSLLVQGNNLPAIEESLGISRSTSKAHARHIYAKFGVANKQELIEAVSSGKLSGDSLRHRQ